MITRQQVIRIADDEGVPTATVERDYVLSPLLVRDRSLAGVRAFSVQGRDGASDVLLRGLPVLRRSRPQSDGGPSPRRGHRSYRRLVPRRASRDWISPASDLDLQGHHDRVRRAARKEPPAQSWISLRTSFSRLRGGPYFGATETSDCLQVCRPTAWRRSPVRNCDA